MSTAMHLDAWWRRLGSAALVGTARRTPPSPADLDVGDGCALAARPDARAEEIALDAAALGGAVRRAGRLPQTGDVVVPAAPPEELDEAPRRAVQLLELLLTQPPSDPAGTEALLLHWAGTCRAAGRRVPHRLLPALLARARSTDLRMRVSVVVGERGAWLAGQNPAWSWLPESRSLQRGMDEIDEQFGPAASAQRRPQVTSRIRGRVHPHAWALLSTDARVRQLREVRSADPAAGRDLLLTSWGSDSAQDRRALLETMEVDLGPDDEDLLESALDDRAAAVRALAADLLDGLPGSRRAARMAERLRPLVVEAGTLRKRLEVRLPDDPDASGRRDGLGRPPPGRSSRGWWLERIVAGAPFEVWEGTSDEVVKRVQEPDVLLGLRRAALARSSADWARPLLDRGLDASLLPDLLAVLPAEQREERVVAALARTPAAGLQLLLRGLPLSWSPVLSGAVVDRVARSKPEETGALLDALMPRLLHGLHDDAVPALQRWRHRAQLTRRHDDQLGSLIQSRTLRHTISEAFQT